MKTLWTALNGPQHIKLLTCTAWRMVESQEVTFARKLVDSLEEQAILDDLMNNTKPSLPMKHYLFHPLLHTPFRYPPLLNGSRFGKKTEKSLWYGALALETAMAEKAFYQLNFLRASDAIFDQMIEQPLTAFSVRVKTIQGIRLEEKPFLTYQKMISSPLSYHASQALGSAMRQRQVQAFTYLSARDQNKGINVALYHIEAFASKTPEAKSLQTWQALATTSKVDFIRLGSLKPSGYSFSLDYFLVDNKLPFPPLE